MRFTGLIRGQKCGNRQTDFGCGLRAHCYQGFRRQPFFSRGSPTLERSYEHGAFGDTLWWEQRGLGRATRIFQMVQFARFIQVMGHGKSAIQSSNFWTYTHSGHFVISIWKFLTAGQENKQCSIHTKESWNFEKMSIADAVNPISSMVNVVAMRILQGISLRMP